MNALELTPVSKNENASSTPSATEMGAAKNTTPDSAGKFKSKLSF